MIINSKEELNAAIDNLKLHSKKDYWSRLGSIERYLQKWNIHSVVVGVSGGVDSALVLAMLSSIPSITVHAVVIDFYMYKEVFGMSYISNLKDAFSNRRNIQWHHFDLTAPHRDMVKKFNFESVTDEFNANTSYSMRYLALFAFAQNFNAVTFGTTNKDEMGYVGWFGKNSDMMVDVQPISDLHKFEVLDWARMSGVPRNIIERIPSGDLIDGSSDEDNFGCTYDELSLLTHLKLRGIELNDFLTSYFSKAIALHEKNAHKYQGQKFNPLFNLD